MMGKVKIWKNQLTQQIHRYLHIKSVACTGKMECVMNDIKTAFLFYAMRI